MRGYTAQIWLATARGGRSTIAELREACKVSDKTLTASVRAMVNNGAIRAFGDGTYGITPECVFPQGVTVVEALDALAVPSAGGAR